MQNKPTPTLLANTVCQRGSHSHRLVWDCVQKTASGCQTWLPEISLTWLWHVPPGDLSTRRSTVQRRYLRCPLSSCAEIAIVSMSLYRCARLHCYVRSLPSCGPATCPYHVNMRWDALLLCTCCVDGFCCCASLTYVGGQMRWDAPGFDARGCLCCTHTRSG